MQFVYSRVGSRESFSASFQCKSFNARFQRVFLHGKSFGASDLQPVIGRQERHGTETLNRGRHGAAQRQGPPAGCPGRGAQAFSRGLSLEPSYRARRRGGWLGPRPLPDCARYVGVAPTPCAAGQGMAGVCTRRPAADHRRPQAAHRRRESAACVSAATFAGVCARRPAARCRRPDPAT